MINKNNIQLLESEDYELLLQTDPIIAAVLKSIVFSHVDATHLINECAL